MNYRVFNMPDEAIEIIGGDTVQLPFVATDEDGTPISITNPYATITWRLSPFEDLSTNVVSKSTTGNLQIIYGTETGQFFVQLLSADTATLHGLYVYQAEIVPDDGMPYRRIQGGLYIWPKIA